MNKTPPIVVTGSIAINRVMSFAGRYRDYIDANSKADLNVSIFLDNMDDTFGGCASSIAYTLALLGEKPILLGSAGPESMTHIQQMSREGVNAQYVHESKLPTATFNVITDGETNQIGGFYPGAMFDSETLSLKPWKDLDPLVIIAPHDPKAMHRQVKECREWNLRMIYDIGQQVSNLPGDEMREGVEAAEILMVNEYEMGVIAKKTGLSVSEIKSNTPIVITTFADKGSVIEGAKVGEPIDVGVVKPKKLVDPTGAGDAYRPGFLYGYARDWPLKACAQLGATCATYAIENMGTQSHRFTLEEITERYEDSFNEPLPSGLALVK